MSLLYNFQILTFKTDSPVESLHLPIWCFMQQFIHSKFAKPYKSKPMKKFLLSAIAVLSGSLIMAQTGVALKMNLEKNKVYRLKSSSEQTVTQTINGNQQTVDSKVDYTLSIRMIDFTPDFMIAEVHFDTLITNTNSMGKVISINSTSEGDIKSSEMGDIMSCIMNRLSKNAVYVKLDYTGKPVEIVNGKMLSDIVLKDTSSITLKGPMASAVKQQIINTTSDDNLKTLIGSFTWFLPGKQVSAGEDWNVSQQLNSGGMLLELKNSYHLNGVKDNSANITAESHIKPAPTAVPIQSGGATVTYDNLQGLSKSTLVVDIRTGLIIEEKAETHISGNLGISAPGVSMQMPMDINGRSKIKAL